MLNVYIHKQVARYDHDERYWVDDFDPANFTPVLCLGPHRKATSAMYLRDGQLFEHNPSFFDTEAQAHDAATAAGFRVLNGERGALTAKSDT
jgi:hypothetical protein